MEPRKRVLSGHRPTGYLHLGHVVNAIYVWGLARALDGQVVLRRSITHEMIEELLEDEHGHPAEREIDAK